jgi:hypothetical protein
MSTRSHAFCVRGSPVSSSRTGSPSSLVASSSPISYRTRLMPAPGRRRSLSTRPKASRIVSSLFSVSQLTLRSRMVAATRAMSSLWSENLRVTTPDGGRP